MKLEKFEVGYNIPAKVGMNIKDVQTPSLIIDYKIFENNILKMKEFITNNKVKLRPHAKMHKSIDVANFLSCSIKSISSINMIIILNVIAKFFKYFIEKYM